MNRTTRELRAIGGHILDLYSIARFNFVNPHSLTKFRLINALRKRTGATSLIETGTYLGVTTERASRIFDRVYTIELDETLARRAKGLFSHNPRVEVIQGDALKQLSPLLGRSDVDNAILFLDGHYSRGITACGGVPEPACEEVEVVARYKAKVRAIVIDDFRTFGTVDDFPTKSEVLRSVERNFPESEYFVQVHLDQVIIVANT